MIKSISCGIDPGSSSGAIAWIIETNDGYVYPEAHEIKNMTEKEIFEKVKYMKELGNKDTKVFAVIEQVHAMPKMGVVAMFTFGQNYGALRMALIGNNIPFSQNTPQAWMKYYSMKRDSKGGEGKTEWKKRLKQRAEQIFPELAVKTNTADALLISNYCKQIYNQ